MSPWGSTWLDRFSASFVRMALAVRRTGQVFCGRSLWRALSDSETGARGLGAGTQVKYFPFISRQGMSCQRDCSLFRAWALATWLRCVCQAVSPVKFLCPPFPSSPPWKEVSVCGPLTSG